MVPLEESSNEKFDMFLEVLRSIDFKQDDSFVVKKLILEEALALYCTNKYNITRALDTQETQTEYRHPTEVNVYLENEVEHYRLTINESIVSIVPVAV